MRYVTFREPRRVKAQDCRAAKEKGKMSVGGQEFKVTPGTTISHSTFLHGDLTDGSYCETGVLEHGYYKPWVVEFIHANDFQKVSL